jgi:hypothetical protein
MVAAYLDLHEDVIHGWVADAEVGRGHTPVERKHLAPSRKTEQHRVRGELW